MTNLMILKLLQLNKYFILLLKYQYYKIARQI